MSAPAEGWDSAVSAWAHGRADIQALVQIGSRVQRTGRADAWSDYDYQLVTSRPELYRDGRFCLELGDCWVSAAQAAFGNVLKVTAVFKEALEADFVVLRSAEVRIAMAALRWPSTRRFWPSALEKGIDDFRIVAAPGWRVVKGGAAWERRYARLAPLERRLSEEQFQSLCGNFWAQSVWAAKKAARGEFHASLRAVHGELFEGCMRMLQEEAALEGRASYPLSRRAEAWLGEERLRALQIPTSPDRAALKEAIQRLGEVFASASQSVASSRGWAADGRQALRRWVADAL